MKMADDGAPTCGATKRHLGVRFLSPEPDVEPDGNGQVFPGTGGMSVAPHKPENLALCRRPKKYGGWGKDPVFRAEADSFEEDLEYRQTLDDETHGLIEPARSMAAEDFQSKLWNTRPLWELA